MFQVVDVSKLEDFLEKRNDAVQGLVLRVRDLQLQPECPEVRKEPLSIE